MSSSEARIRANQANAVRSTSPVTPEGKERSRANSYKHGLTGGGIVMPEREAVEVERRVAAFAAELKPSGSVGVVLVRRAATMSVRMERCVEQENAALAERTRRAEAEFVPPEGADDETAARLRVEAGRVALFDPSPEATLARKYEAAAERSFFRALVELRLFQAAENEAETKFVEHLSREVVASFSRREEEAAVSAPPRRSEAPLPPRRGFGGVVLDAPVGFEGRVDVPITIGRRR